ncbi:hypothetical protein KFZ67_05985 [Photobacterium damselae]|uniref:anti-phage protein KwaA n=1 Tax=Photobacterium damselae TaxID=38293 RepID=UPI0011D0E487|nr:anti-phage protein KwaA [Photobacterium damselae]KAB1506945.1 hypothetical protein FD717_016170 [Photobacterium damselae subsp. damselae]
MKIFEQVKLYILSLTFLFVIIIIITINPLRDQLITPSLTDYITANLIPISMLLLLAWSILIKKQFEFELQGNSSDSLLIKECESEDYENLTFLATYIIPFAGLSFDSTQKVFAYIVLLSVIGIMVIKTEKYYANPTLAILGYKLYRVTLADMVNNYTSVIVITKNDLQVGDNVCYKFLSKSVCFVRKTNNEHRTS